LREEGCIAPHALRSTLLVLRSNRWLAAEPLLVCLQQLLYVLHVGVGQQAGALAGTVEHVCAIAAHDELHAVVRALVAAGRLDHLHVLVLRLLAAAAVAADGHRAVLAGDANVRLAARGAEVVGAPPLDVVLHLVGQAVRVVHLAALVREEQISGTASAAAANTAAAAARRSPGALVTAPAAAVALDELAAVLAQKTSDVCSVQLLRGV
jgi:hypothetical protein